MKKIIDIYKSLTSGECLLPTSTGFDFWDDVYVPDKEVYDREFARKYSAFSYYDFLGDEETTMAETKSDLKADVLSILTFNQKKYAEMYRIFLVEDEDDPITYNYDMTETTGAQHSETEYGARSSTKGQQSNTIGQQSNTIGQIVDTHAVAPMNSVTPVTESTDTTAQRSDTIGQRSDTEGSRTDTELAHTDQTDTDAWTLTRKGNIGVQTAGDIIRIHTDYWTNRYKFMDMIFDDINAELLLIGE